MFCLIAWHNGQLTIYDHCFHISPNAQTAQPKNPTPANSDNQITRSWIVRGPCAMPLAAQVKNASIRHKTPKTPEIAKMIENITGSMK